MTDKQDAIRIMIVDDHAVVREGLHTLLEAQPDMEVVGEAANGEEAANMSSELKPDIILMDIAMPVKNGLEATSIIKRNCPEINILILTMHDDDQYFYKILEAGASGYFVKGGSSAELLSALRAVYEGNVFLYPTMAKKLLGDYLERVKSGHHKESYGGLTRREREVLTLIAEGYSNQQIATELNLSSTTIQTHRANIMSKLNLHNRTELVKYAISHGLITLDT